MQNYRFILAIGVTEILIGGITLFFNFVTLALSQNNKPSSVLFFVIITGVASILLGIGFLKFDKTAYKLLLYFASVIMLSKILLMMDVIQLNGALETTIPGPVKNTVSILYHGFVIYYLNKPGIKRIFHGEPPKW